MNKNIEYEKLTQDIYQNLLNLNSHGIKTIDVQHNRTDLQGQSGQKHQIDVYWEYKKEDTIYKAIVECKNYKNPISIGKVRDFFGVLRDYSGVINDVNHLQGIMVTKKGYTRGAKKFAKYYGIHLKLIRKPEAKDWEGGKLKTIFFTQSIGQVQNIKIGGLLHDEEWIKEHLKISGSINFITHLVCGLQVNNNIIFFDNHKVILPLPEFKMWKNSNNLEYNYIPYNDLYINTENHGIIKIKGIKFIYDFIVAQQNFTLDGEQIIKIILKDVFDGSVKFFDHNGNVK